LSVDLPASRAKADNQCLVLTSHIFTLRPLCDSRRSPRKSDQRMTLSWHIHFLFDDHHFICCSLFHPPRRFDDCRLDAPVQNLITRSVAAFREDIVRYPVDRVNVPQPTSSCARCRARGQMKHKPTELQGTIEVRTIERRIKSHPLVSSNKEQTSIESSI
jgi:hypothetical protein